MKSELISIIIPVYNGEKYIRDCVETIFKQSYNNYELIIVNDGSTDNTRAILETFKDKRLKLYNVKNGGVSRARNYGLKMAQGEFVLFVDADDILADNALEVLINQERRTKADIIRFNGYIENSNKTYTKLEMPIESGTIYNSKKDKDKIVDIFNSPKKSLRCYSPLLFLKNVELILFNTNLTYLEDKVFYLANMLDGNKNILFINDCLYYYRYNDQSKTKNINIFSKNIEDILIAKEEIAKLVCKYIKDGTTIVDDSIMSLIIYRLEYLTEIAKYGIFKKNIKEAFKLEGILKLFRGKVPDFKFFQKVQYCFLKHRCYLMFYIITKVKIKLKELRK